MSAVGVLSARSPLAVVSCFVERESDRQRCLGQVQRTIRQPRKEEKEYVVSLLGSGIDPRPEGYHSGALEEWRST